LSFWFLLSLIGVLAVVPLHFLSVEHGRLETRFGPERGQRIGSILAMISGWGIFLFYFGLWISPQPRFDLLPLGVSINLAIPGFFSLEIPVFHLISGVLVLLPGAYLGIKGVTDMGLETAETHRPVEVIAHGIYGRMRHPQYLGAMLSHIGATLLLSALYSFLVTPLIMLVNYVLCWKEEREMIREFGDDYLRYQRSVPMFL
jgi:protein-S-isoprenylcysteine O-methyltransferase Ste14